MGLGGIIMGALGGAGEQAASIGTTLMKSELDKDKFAYESDITLQRTKALEEFKNTLAVNTSNQQRNAQVDRINAASPPILAGAVAGNANKYYGDDSSLTADDLSPEEQARFAATPHQAAEARTQAAISTGDIDPKTAASLDNKSEGMLYKSLYEGMKEEGRDNRADARVESSNRNADLRAETSQRLSDNRLAALMSHMNKQGQQNPTKEALSFLSESRKEIAGKSAEVRSLQKQELDDPRLKPDGRKAIMEKYQTQFDELDAQRKAVEKDYGTLRKRIGLAGDDDSPAPAPAPKPAPALSSLPSGAVQIGTSGGKPVYQTPDGKKFIAK